MKFLVYETQVEAEDLVARFVVATDKIKTTPGIFERVLQSFFRRCHLCNDTRVVGILSSCPHFSCYKNAGYMTFRHFTSGNFVMTVSLKDCALLVKLFYKNNDCASIALLKFRTLKDMKKGVGPMTTQSPEKMIQKFEETDSFHVQSGRGRKRVNSTVVDGVATVVQKESSGGLQPCSARRIARTLDRPGAPNTVSQQDNVRPHLCGISTNNLTGFDILPWPANSPDLNPIEHQWALIGCDISRGPLAQIVNDLRTTRDVAWQWLPQTIINGLIAKIPRRIEACIAARVGHIRY
ncbi:uncharacterized protein TNCV_3934651 [Trichonephila clavipes]|nr:uncharacterized protein TNCV_3934651 [Trichonephila clavipes]